MPSLTIRLRDDADREAIKSLQSATYETTASKALMKAAKGYPGLLRTLREEEQRNGRLVALLTDLVEAQRGLSAAEERCRQALTRAADALGMPSPSNGRRRDRAPR